MADSDSHLSALKRQRAHLLAVDADPGKVAENAEQLRLAGVDPDELEDKPKKDDAPVDRNAGERQTTDAPTTGKRSSAGRPKREEPSDVSGSGGLTLPKSGGGNE